MMGATRRIRVTIALAAILAVAGPVARTATAATVAVRAGGDLQAALDAAQPGDTIVLQAGATFVGNFVLRAKSGDDYITIRSSGDGLPAENTRIDPRHAGQLAALRSPNTAAALATAPGAHHYRLQWLEFRANLQGRGDIITLGDGSSRQNTLDLVPHHLIVDRVYIHGDVTVGQKRGIGLNSASTSIVNSYISEIKAPGQDSQAIAGWNGPGPFLISNNYLEAASENVMFGGADPAIAGLVPSDITFTRNHLSKPWSWRGGPWNVKNLFELKNAQRVVVDGNLMENNWAEAQTGYAILLKSVNQDGGCPWCVVQDVLFTNNVVRHVSSAINILGHDTRYPALMANNIAFRNNLFEDVSGVRYGADGRFVLINGGANIAFDHNTVINDGAATIYGYGLPSTGFVLTNNVLLDNMYGIRGADTGSGHTALAMFFPGAQVFGNIFAGFKPALYPAANFYPASLNAVGFSSSAGGNYRLSSASIYRGGATDGTDPGADFDALHAATRTPPPPGPAPHTPLPPGAGSPPGTPRNLVATATGSTVTIGWIAGASGGTPTSYVLEAGTRPGGSDAAAFDTGNDRTSFVTQGVPAGTYYLRLRSANAHGGSAPSAEVSLVVGASSGCTSAPDAPRNLQATVTGTTVTLRWDAAAGCAPAHYVLHGGSGPALSDLARVTLTEAALTVAAPPGTYYVRVAAVNASGTSAASNETIVTVRTP
jgi:hypothetical protein